MPRGVRDQTPRWTKVLLGIVIGCGALAVIGLVALVLAGGFGFWWAMTPGEQVSTQRVMGPECEAALAVGDIASDEQATLAVARLFEELQRASRARRRRRMPESMRWLEGFGQGGRIDRRSLEMLLPSEATVALDLGGESPSFTAAVNFRAYTRMVKAMFGFAGARRVPTPEGELYTTSTRRVDPEEAGAFGFYKGTLLFSDRLEAARRAMRRLAGDAAPGASASDLAARLRALQTGDGLVVGVARAGALRRQVVAEERPGLAALLEGARWVDLSLRIISADEIAGTTAIEHASMLDAQQAPARVAALSAAWQHELADDGLFLTALTETVGARSESHWRLTGLEAALTRTFEEANRSPERRRSYAPPGDAGRFASD
jgi:hypothetical protein